FARWRPMLIHDALASNAAEMFLPPLRIFRFEVCFAPCLYTQDLIEKFRFICFERYLGFTIGGFVNCKMDACCPLWLALLTSVLEASLPFVGLSLPSFGLSLPSFGLLDSGDIYVFRRLSFRKSFDSCR
ncbi:hypothetical protein ISN44_As13g022430, partial [Arabidopsis suecica]